MSHFAKSRTWMKLCFYVCWFALFDACRCFGQAEPAVAAVPAQAVEQSDNNDQDAAAEAEVAEEMVVVMDGFAFGDDGEDAQFLVLRRYLHAECGLARRACQLSEAQVESLSHMDDKWLKEQLAKPNPANQNQVLRGIGRFLGGQFVNPAQPQDQQAGYLRVRKIIDEQLASTLTEQQREAYEFEKQARETFHHEAIAGVLVVAYDNHVYVKQNQRQELNKAIAKWVGSKKLYWQFYFQNQAYIPAVPNTILAKCLTEQQVDSLKGLNSYSYEMDDVQLEMNGMNQGIEFNDE